eukprot:symbB.v1.2.014817.t1/scaffold1090.1/size140082/6
MDLAHLVTVGLFPAKHEPLTSADLAYFQQHGVDDVLAEIRGFGELCDCGPWGFLKLNHQEIVSQLAKQKPSDPFKFIADAVAKKTGGVVAKEPSKGPKDQAAPSKAPKQKEATAPAPKAAAATPSPAGAVDEAAVKKVGDELRALKEKLKQEGKSSKDDINATAEVQDLVAKLVELKNGNAEAPKAEAPKAEAPKAEAWWSM